MRFLLLFASIVPLTGAAAAPFSSPPLSPGQQCQAAIAAAERAHGLPPLLLAAIGRVESGRRDPATGAWGSWPWTINAEGTGTYFATKAEAVAAVESLRARGVRSIDVGCMQVNLMHHPSAFVSLDQAFEAAANADYAARFLVRLRDQTGDWTKATAYYHSANPAEGGPYAAKVAAALPEEQRSAAQAPVPVSPPRAALFASAVPRFAAPSPRMILAPLGAPPAGSAPPGLPSAGVPGGLPGGLSTGLTAGPSGGPGAILGRTLESYRAMPIRIAMRIPPLPQR